MKLILVVLGLLTLTASASAQTAQDCTRIERQLVQCQRMRGQCDQIQRAYSTCTAQTDQAVRGRVQQMQPWQQLPMQGPFDRPMPPTPR